MTRRTIIVIDDDSVFRESIARYLGKEYDLVQFETLQAAREGVFDQSADCVLLDYRLPDGEGISLLPDLVESRFPVVMCTAQGNEALAVRALHEGADDYLAKNDLKKLELARAIDNAMERARLREIVRQRDMEKDALIAQLQTALNDIETLRGLIPICARCKKVRDDAGYWHVVEAYVSKHTQASFTHGYCPDCYEREVKAIHDQR